MNKFRSSSGDSTQRIGVLAAEPTLYAAMWWLLAVGFALLATSMSSLADSRTGTTSARASVDFRIVIPAIIRVTAVTQPDQLVIDERHIALGYIDLDAGTSVKLTSNNRAGYLLAATFDTNLLSSLEVRISSQNLTTSSGYGSMRVTSGLTIDKVVPIGYRLHLAPGVVAGAYRWPVALAFSLAAA